MSVREIIKEEDGKVHVHRSQNVSGIIEHNKIQSELQPNSFGHDGMRYVGEVPFVVVEIWQKECGARIGSDEFMAYVKKKLMDPDFKKLRVKGY